MPDHRFVMHIMPVVVASGAAGLFIVSSPGARLGTLKPGARALFVYLLPAVALMWNGLTLSAYASADSYEKAWHRHQAQWYGGAAYTLAGLAGQDDAIACGDIGYIGYITNVDRIIDTNGLVEAHLAKLPGAAMLQSDPGYVFDLRPQWLVIMVHYFGDEETLGHSAFDRAALESDRLTEEYELVAEEPGWKWSERSFHDKATRESEVRFRIYKRR